MAHLNKTCGLCGESWGSHCGHKCPVPHTGRGWFGASCAECKTNLQAFEQPKETPSIAKTKPQTGESTMLFNVQVTRKVNKFNEDKTESVQIERVLANVPGVVAVNATAAAAIAGRKIPPAVTDEDLSTAAVSVQQVTA